jgi:hypothetical protein
MDLHSTLAIRLSGQVQVPSLLVSWVLLFTGGTGAGAEVS